MLVNVWLKNGKHRKAYVDLLQNIRIFEIKSLIYFPSVVNCVDWSNLSSSKLIDAFYTVDANQIIVRQLTFMCSLFVSNFKAIKLHLSKRF